MGVGSCCCWSFSDVDTSLATRCIGRLVLERVWETRCVWVYIYICIYMGAGQNQRFVPGPGPTLATYAVTKGMYQ